MLISSFRPEGDGKQVLENVSITINPGQIVGIAGRAGRYIQITLPRPSFADNILNSGKTSLLLAILNLLGFSGSICIDDREIRTIPRDTLRSRITSITQFGLELKGSVRLNMDPFDPFLRPSTFFLEDEMLKGILRRVALWDFVEEHGGLDADFAEMNFSYEQNQLFQLARAILHKQAMRTKIVLIDEGTTGTDLETETLIHQVIREVFNDCTILIVSHRMSLFDEADVILRLDNGRAKIYNYERDQGRWVASEWNTS